jgi:hypothetical protein
MRVTGLRDEHIHTHTLTLESTACGVSLSWAPTYLSISGAHLIEDAAGQQVGVEHLQEEIDVCGEVDDLRAHDQVNWLKLNAWPCSEL